MTDRENIIRLARSAGLATAHQQTAIERLAALVRAEEREHLMGSVRPVVVEAIRSATGCPDLIGRDGKALTDSIEELMRIAIRARSAKP